MKKLVSKLDDVSRVEQFKIYLDIFTKCFAQRDMGIFKYIDEFLGKWEEFLSFEKRPGKAIRDVISADFELIFRFIRASNNMEAFNRYLPTFLENEKYLTNYYFLASIYDAFGYLMWLKQDIDSGLKYLSKSLEIANKHCKVDELPGRYTNLGYLYEVKGNLKKAEYYYNEGLDFALRNNSINALKLAYNAIGRLYIGKSFFEKAIDYFEDSLSLYDQEKDADRVAVVNNLAMCYRALDNNEKAKELYESLDKEWLLQNNPELYYAVQVNIGNILFVFNKMELAEEKYISSLKFAEKFGVKDQIISIYISLADLYNATDRTNDSFGFLEKALKLSIETKNHRKLKSIYLQFVNVYMEQHKYQEVLIYLDKLMEIYKSVKNRSSQIKILRKQATCHEKLKEYKKAYACLASVEKQQDIIDSDKTAKMKKDELKLVGKSRQKQFIFQGNDSLISRELSAKIGVNLIGKNPAMQALINKVLLVATNNNASILIKGESGTGKDIIAKIIHYSSSRKNHPFIAVNSGSFATGVVESALFGHKKGAFTGAVTDHMGYFQAANQGSVFLDEIGEMPLEVQITLLRVLEEKKVLPIGSSETVPVNFRLISATNVDVNKHVQDNKFRVDFFNRINTLEIEIPPLRDRKDDIPILVESFLDELSARLDIKKPNLSISALRLLVDYDFPGNVRELKNMIEKLIIFNTNNEITADDVYNLNINVASNGILTPNSSILNLEVLEKQAIISAMAQAKHVKTEAAKLLGITSYALLRRIKKYEMEF